MSSFDPTPARPPPNASAGDAAAAMLIGAMTRSGEDPRTGQAKIAAVRRGGSSSLSAGFARGEEFGGDLAGGASVGSGTISLGFGGGEAGFNSATGSKAGGAVLAVVFNLRADFSARRAASRSALSRK